MGILRKFSGEGLFGIFEIITSGSRKLGFYTNVYMRESADFVLDNPIESKYEHTPKRAKRTHNSLLMKYQELMNMAH